MNLLSHLRPWLAIRPVRWATLQVLHAANALGRLASFCRTRALFPAAPDLVCHWSSDIKYPQNITVGRQVVIGVNVTLGAHAPIRLDDHVRISKDVVIETAGLDFASGQPPYRHVSAPIVLREGAWIGTRSIILGGVTVGRHAVVAAGSVVTKDVPDGTTVAGVPARPVQR